MKAAGCSFVIVKATQGTTGTDPNFLSNINAANAAGLQTNAYHYYEAGTESEAKAEANHFISVLKQADVKGYVFVDVESNSTVDALDKETLTSEVNVFLDQLASAGYTKLGIYSNKSFYENNLDDASSALGCFSGWLDITPNLGSTPTFGSTPIRERLTGLPAA
ncbi:GH25 family lysozyme [Terrilactibacillus sp. S3-3]|nr:GH25 family lysozyme [Terrilactibacillus sp. S3-3]